MVIYLVIAFIYVRLVSFAQKQIENNPNYFPGWDYSYRSCLYNSTNPISYLDTLNYIRNIKTKIQTDTLPIFTFYLFIFTFLFWEGIYTFHPFSNTLRNFTWYCIATRANVLYVPMGCKKKNKCVCYSQKWRKAYPTT